MGTETFILARRQLLERLEKRREDLSRVVARRPDPIRTLPLDLLSYWVTGKTGGILSTGVMKGLGTAAASWAIAKFIPGRLFPTRRRGVVSQLLQLFS